MGVNMTKEELFKKLKEYTYQLLKEHNLLEEVVSINAKGLSKEEAIGRTKRKDYPILTGKEVMMCATLDGVKGQAFTAYPSQFQGTMKELLDIDLATDEYGRGLFIAALNALSAKLGIVDRTVHCKNAGPEECAIKLREYLNQNFRIKKIALVGYQPAMIHSLASTYLLRVLDLNQKNIGTEIEGIRIEDGNRDFVEVIEWAELILCTGSTLCNGTIVDYLKLDKRVLFYGTTLAGAAPCLLAERVCFTEESCI